MDQVEQIHAMEEAMDQIEQIRAMEEAMDKIAAANETLDQALEQWKGVLKEAVVLSEYLGSDEWFDAFDADEAGLLPDDLKRGVLSEDGAYNTLVDYHDHAIAMLEAAALMLKKW